LIRARSRTPATRNTWYRVSGNNPDDGYLMLVTRFFDAENLALRAMAVHFGV
jgi:hypothetical protein